MTIALLRTARVTRSRQRRLDVRSILGLVAGCLLLAACGGSGEEGTAGGSTVGASTTTGAASSGGTHGGTAPTAPDAPTGTTVVISPQAQCFDRYLQQEPSVTNQRQYYATDTDDQRKVQLNQPSRGVDVTNHALFVLESGRAAGAVKFSYSGQDVLTVHEVRDAACEEVDWGHEGNEIDLAEDGATRVNRATIAAEFEAGSTYEIAFEVVDIMSQGLVIRKEYFATVLPRGADSTDAVFGLALSGS